MIIDKKQNFEPAWTHHRPRTIGYLGILSETTNNFSDKVIIVFIAGTKEDLAYDVGGCVMEHEMRTQCLACKRHDRRVHDNNLKVMMIRLKPESFTHSDQ